MKTLLIAESAVVALAGLPLAVFPSVMVSLPLGSPLDDPVGTVVGRSAGAALLTLGTAYWRARNGSQDRAMTGLILAMLLYDTTVVVVLLFTRLAPALSGIDRWPVVEAHAGLGVCCLVCLSRDPGDHGETDVGANRRQLMSVTGWSRDSFLAGSTFAHSRKCSCYATGRA
jgi:hypothetical protein